MAEALQEELLRGPVIVPEVKPWTAKRLEEDQAEYGQLRLTKCFLENQLVGVNDRMVVLRVSIMEGLLNTSITQAKELGLKPTGGPKSKLSREDPGGLGYGRTETPLDVRPRPNFVQRTIDRVVAHLL